MFFGFKERPSHFFSDQQPRRGRYILAPRDELACFVCTVQIKAVSIFTLAVPAPQQRRQSRSSGSVCQCPIGHSTPRLLNEPSPPSQPCRRCGGCGAASPISESLAIALTLRWLNCPCQFSSLQLTGSLKTSSLQPSNSASNRLQ